MIYNLDAWGKVHRVEIRKSTYCTNGNLAISLFELREGPYATLTVNLDDTLPLDMGYVDTNNCYWAEEFIQKNGLGEPTGEYGYSGFCSYPLYKFNLEKL